MVVSVRGPFVGVLIIRALLFGVYDGAPDFWKLSNGVCYKWACSSVVSIETWLRVRVHRRDRIFNEGFKYSLGSRCRPKAPREADQNSRGKGHQVRHLGFAKPLFSKEA